MTTLNLGSRAYENLKPAIIRLVGFVITKSNEDLLRVWGWMDRFIIITPNIAKQILNANICSLFRTSRTFTCCLRSIWFT